MQNVETGWESTAPGRRGDRDGKWAYLVAVPRSDPSWPRSVLVVDDEPALLSALGRLFEGAGYTVHRAATAAEGLDQWERHAPDVTVLDLVLPDLSGIQVLKRLRARGATVLMLTGRGEIEDAVEAMQLGADTFLTKPPDLNHLLAAVARAAEHAELRRRNAELQRAVGKLEGRRLRTALVVVALVVVALFVGRMLGGPAAVDRTRAPIPIPVDSQ